MLLPSRLLALVGGFALFSIACMLALSLLPENSKLQILLKEWLPRYLASAVAASWSGRIPYFERRPGRKEKPDALGQS